MKSVVTSRDCAVLVGFLTVLGVIAGFVPAANAANLVARWKLNEAGSIHADSGPNGVSLVQDATTTTAINAAGIEATSAQLNWQPSPGVATRLAATNAAIQTDSFGFAFWLNPIFINDFDNLIAKEMAFYNTTTNYLRLSWQVHLLGNNGSNAAPLELIVRGDNRAQGDFFGTAVSTTTVLLHTNTGDWIHVAGGYDSATGALRLYVNGVETVSGNSSPGAHNSGGSPFSMGTAKNGTDFVDFAAGACIEDMQLYDGPPTAAEVTFLKANPGQAIRSFVISGFSNSSNGDVAATVSTVPGAIYTVEVASGLGGFTAVTNITALMDYTPIVLSKAAIDGVLGPAPRSKLFLRAQEQFVLSGFATCD